MMTITKRLATLDPKAKAATRTAKDGEEYSQLVLEVSGFDFDEGELNATCNSPHAYQSIKSMFEKCPSVMAVELEEKIESASVVMGLAAVNANNGAEFSFKYCRIDNLTVNREMKGAMRITTKPALDSKFGQLIQRLGHTVMIEMSGAANSDQKELPLNTVGTTEHGTSSVGTPKQERDRAHAKERQIAAELEAAHNGTPVKREKVDTKTRKTPANGDRAPAH